MNTLEMNTLDKLGLAILTTVAVFVGAQASAMAQPSGTTQSDDMLKSRLDLNNISQRTTLLIIGSEDGHQVGSIGSGSLIAKEGDRCLGVTNAHVVALPGRDLTFVARTFDNEFHEVADILLFRYEDLALFAFDCEQEYEPIALAAYPLTAGQEVYLSGWPANSTPEGSFVRQFTSGAISAILDRPRHGYQVSYTQVADSVMAGGQVLDEAGRLVAIHGLGATEDPTILTNCHLGAPGVATELAHKTGFNYGIPVTTLLAGAVQRGFDSGLNVAYTAPLPSGKEPTISDQQDNAQQDGYLADAGDRVNFYDMMDRVERTIDTATSSIDIVCGFWGC